MFLLIHYDSIDVSLFRAKSEMPIEHNGLSYLKVKAAFPWASECGVKSSPLAKTYKIQMRGH